MRIIVEGGVQRGDGRVDAHGEPIALADTHTFWHIFSLARRAGRPVLLCRVRALADCNGVWINLAAVGNDARLAIVHSPVRRQRRPEFSRFD